MARLALIFAIVFLMVLQAHADPRGGGRSWGGGGGWHGGGHSWGGGGRSWGRPNIGPVWRGGGGWRGGSYGRGYGGGGWNNGVGGFLGGLLGGALWHEWAQPEPAPIIVEQPRTEEWCLQRFRSYDPVTHTYLGFDGLRHGCP